MKLKRSNLEFTTLHERKLHRYRRKHPQNVADRSIGRQCNRQKTETNDKTVTVTKNRPAAACPSSESEPAKTVTKAPAPAPGRGKVECRCGLMVDIAIDAMEGTDDDVAIDHAKSFYDHSEEK